MACLRKISLPSLTAGRNFFNKKTAALLQRHGFKSVMAKFGFYFYTGAINQLLCPPHDYRLR